MRNACVALLFLGFQSAAAQTSVAPDTTRAAELLVVEQDWRGPEDSVVVRLRKGGVYRAEVLGTSAPLTAVAQDPPRYPAFVYQRDGAGADGSLVFELHPARSALHVLKLAGMTPGSEVVLRVYSNELEAQRFAQEKDRKWGIGLALAAGFHSSYRLEPVSGIDPAGGSAMEGCLVLDSGRGVSGCLGGGYESLPGMDYGIEWAFAEARVQLLSGRLIGDRLSQAGILFRAAQGGATRSRNID
ncbi:MAG TPA: hypothetical protein VH763_04790, partial [Gemmatimonadales bacterium]